jgi:hypothetical protein
MKIVSIVIALAFAGVVAHAEEHAAPAAAAPAAAASATPAPEVKKEEGKKAEKKHKQGHGAAKKEDKAAAPAAETK